MSEILADAVKEIEKLQAGRPRAAPRVLGAADINLIGDPLYAEISEGYLLIYWGGYEYDIALERIKTPLHLLGIISHISQKTWELTTPERIADLIDLVCHEKGWDHHGW